MKSSFAILFDMDGVLVDSNPVHKIALKQFCKKHGQDLTEQQLRDKIYGRTNKDWISRLFPGIDEQTLNKYAAEKEALFRELYANQIIPVKGLITFLEKLNQHRVPVAIGTSAPRANVDFTLSKTGIEKYFQTILDEAFVMKGKPDPEIYIRCAAALNYSPDKCVVFEDSISGVHAGKAAGCKVVGVTTTHTSNELGNIDLAIQNFEGLDIEDINRLFMHVNR